MIQYFDWNSGIDECFDGIFSHTQGLSHYTIDGPVKIFETFFVNKEKFMEKKQKIRPKQLSYIICVLCEQLQVLFYQHAIVNNKRI
jgi:hypothetical protein